MLYYFDSSAVVKRYAPEAGSAWVKAVVQPAAGNTVCLSQIGVVEIAAALSRKVRTGELTLETYEAALAVFLGDVRNEEYLVAPVSDHVIELAVELTRHDPLRGYDAVQLATALVLNNILREAELPPLTFVSADETLIEVARGKGVSSENPKTHR